MTKFVKAIKDFSGGLSEVANDNIPDNRLVTAKNVVPGDGYGIARAGGTSIFNQIEDVGPVVFLTELVVETLTHIIAGVEVQVDSETMWNLYDWDGNSWTLVERAAGSDSEEDPEGEEPAEAEETEEAGDSNIYPILSWFIYANKLFWLDGVGYRYYDGTNMADVEKPEEVNESIWNKVVTSVAVEPRGRQWFFATSNNEIIFSDVGYYDVFQTTSIINITSGLNDNITALHEFNDGMLIFQKRSIYYLTGWDLTGGTDIMISKLSAESGTKWPKSVKTISNAVLYLGDNGVYKLSIPYFTSSVASTNISDKQASKRLMAPAEDIYAEVFNGVYYITLRNGLDIKEYRYYLDSKSWWGEYTQKPYCYASKLNGEDYLFLGCGDGYVLYYDSNSSHYISTENGMPTSISIEVLTKGYDVVGGTVIDSKVKRVFIVFKQYDAQQSGLTVQVKTDYLEGAWSAEVDSMQSVMTAVLQDISGDESLVWSEGLWSQAYWGWIDTVTKQFQLNKKCKRVQFEFTDDSSDEPLLVYGIAMLYKKKKAKGSRMGVTESEIKYKN